MARQQPMHGPLVLVTRTSQVRGLHRPALHHAGPDFVWIRPRAALKSFRCGGWSRWRGRDREREFLDQNDTRAQPATSEMLRFP